jgi:tRNA A37 threonylcarbamoyladenosine biosynthesis protein TsaE
MYNLDTKEEIDFEYFMEVLRNNELQVVSKEWTEEEWKQLSKDLAICKANHQEKPVKEPVLI